MKPPISGLQTVIAGIVLLGVLGTFVTLVLTGREVNTYFYLLSLIGVPSLIGVLAVNSADRARDEAHKVRKTVAAVERHVNGNTARLMNDRDRLQRQVDEYRARYGDLTEPGTPTEYTD